MLWTEEDRVKALVWLAEQDARCSGCGHLLDECMAIENDGTYTATAVVCHACAARDRAASVRGTSGDEGVYWKVR